MQLQLATLCDSAADYQGKLCVLGAFDTLCAQEFPVTHPQCSFALRMLFESQDRGRHEMMIQLTDEEGTEVMPAFTPVMEVSFPTTFQPFVTRNLVLNLQRLCFQKPGIYRFTIGLNGRTLISIPLRVTRLDNMRGTAGPAG